MADFDPDAYLAKKQPDFDPDTYLANNKTFDPKEAEAPPARAKSSYDGVPDWKLNLLQKAEKKAGDIGLVPPGMEMISPAAIDQKKRAMATAANDLTLGYLPNAVSAVKNLSVSSPDYVKDRDSLQKYLDETGGGTKAVGHALGALGGMMIPTGAAKAGEPVLKSFAKSVATGAGLAGAANPGNVEGEVTPLQLPERFQNAKTGALLSGALAAPGTAVRYLRERLASEPAKNADEVIRIAKSIGVPEEEIPTELLTTNKQVRDKAASLQRDPTLGGEMVRKKLQPFQDTLQNTAEGFVADAHPASETGATVGSRLRTQIPEEVDAKLAPAKKAYDELADPLASATPNQQAMKAGSTMLSNSVAPGDSTGELRKIIDTEKQHFLDNINSVADLKQYRTDIGKRSRDAYRQGNSRVGEVYSNLYDVLTRERDRSLERALETGGGPAAVDKLRAADKLYGETVNNTLGAIGIDGKRSQGPMSTVKDYLNGGSPDQLPEKLWSGKNNDQSTAFQQQFPKQHEDIRKLILQRVQKAASKGPELSPTALNTQLTKMTPETQTRLLGENAGALPDYQTLTKAMPDPNFNPSQTNIRSETLRNLNPYKQVGSVAGAAELNLRRPLPFVKEQGAASTMVRDAGRNAITQQSMRNFSPEAVIPKVQGSQYEKTLTDAAQRGDNGFQSTYFLLHQSDPKFREMVDKDAQDTGEQEQ